MPSPTEAAQATSAATLDLSTDVVTLTAAVCDIESVSQDEAALADAIEAALRPLAHLQVERDGNTVVARTSLGRAERVVLAGHIDTVPLTAAPNLPTAAGRRAALGPRHRRHEGRRRRHAPGRRAGRGARPATSPSSSTTARRSTAASTASADSPTPAPSCSRATSRCCSSRPTAPSRAAARAPCGSRSSRPAPPPTRPVRGRATTPSTTPPTCWPGWPPTRRRRSRSTVSTTTRRCRPWASAAASRATSSPTGAP